MAATTETAAIPSDPSLQRHLPIVRPGAVAIPGPNIGIERSISTSSVDYRMGAAGLTTNTSIATAADSISTQQQYQQQQQPDFTVFDPSSDGEAGREESTLPPPTSLSLCTTGSSATDFIVTAQVVDEEEIQRQVQKEIDRRMSEHDRMLTGISVVA